MTAIVGSVLSTVRLTDFGLKRAPPRPVDDRQQGYEALFDYDTLFYDIFRSADGKSVIFLGPPLLNCEPALIEAVFRTDGVDRPLKANYTRSPIPYQPSCRFQLSIPEEAAGNRITIEAVGHSLTVPVQPSGSNQFSGRRVVVTMIKDTPLPWVADWAQFHARIHGAQSFIVYDNGSSAYRIEDIRACLDGIGEPLSNLVLSWNFPYGPNVGPRNVQDSFYCQPGALDHARRRYCASARAVLNCDVDELVVGPPGQSVFDEVERSRGPGLLMHGRWVETVQELTMFRTDPSNLIRHIDCVYAQGKQSLLRAIRWKGGLLRTKWVAVPARCDNRVAWTVHDLVAMDGRHGRRFRPTRSRRFMYRHFRQVTNGWVARRRSVRRYIPLKHLLDRELVAAFKNAFDQPPKTLGSHLSWLISRARNLMD